MKKVIFKFIGNYPIYIRIIDNNHNTIHNEKTCNGIINVCLEKYKAYTLIAISNNRVLKRVFYIDDKTNKFVFYFYSRVITFLLKDYYYNLPIKKGELILWQK